MSHTRLSLLPECAKLLCFRYYSGLNLSCLAQSEPLSLPGLPGLPPQLQPPTERAAVAVQAPRPKGSSVSGRAAKGAKGAHHRGACGASSTDSDSDGDADPRQRKHRKQKSWRLHKKAASDKATRAGRRAVNGVPDHDGRDAVDGDGPAQPSPLRSERSEGATQTSTSVELPTWNSHEAAQRALDGLDANYYPIWPNGRPVAAPAPAPAPTQAAPTGDVSRRLYETLYPAEEPPPPPLPPRAHRPLERTRAVHLSVSAPIPPPVPPPAVPPPPAPRHKSGALPALPPRPGPRRPPPADADGVVPSRASPACQCESAPLATPEGGSSFETLLDDSSAPLGQHVCVGRMEAECDVEGDAVVPGPMSSLDDEASTPRCTPRGTPRGTPSSSRRPSVDHAASPCLLVPDSSASSTSSSTTPSTDSGVAPASAASPQASVSTATSNAGLSSSESLGRGTSPEISQVSAANGNGNASCVESGPISINSFHPERRWCRAPAQRL